MRVLRLVPQPPAENAPLGTRSSLISVRALIGTQAPVGQKAGKRPLWWAIAQGQHLCYDPKEFTLNPASTSLEALKTARLTLNLWRQGRQIAAELGLALTTPSEELTYPVTLFTGSWVAHLLGYTRKYRSAKIVETFTGLALRSYLILYRFLPLSLCVKGPFSNFNFFWKLINAPAKQVFLHPILNEPVWDIYTPEVAGASMDAVRAKLREMLPEIGCGGALSLDEASLGFEAQRLGEAAKLHRGAGDFRYTLMWGQVLFMPTRVNLPRKAKKARSIRKRLAKRLVRAAGRRFWPR